KVSLLPGMLARRRRLGDIPKASTVVLPPELTPSLLCVVLPEEPLLAVAPFLAHLLEEGLQLLELALDLRARLLGVDELCGSRARSCHIFEVHGEEIVDVLLARHVGTLAGGGARL